MNQEDHNLLRAYDPQGAVATCLAFSADGKKFAVGTETGQLALYGVDDGKLIGKLTGATGGLYALAFRPDGAQLAAGGFDGVVRLYDLSTGRLAKAFVPVPLVQKRM
jgi:WD40 repeat protein